MQRSTSPSRERKRSHTPEGWPMPPLPMFHSTSLLVLHRLSSDLPGTQPCTPVLQSESELASLDLGGGNARPIYSAGAPVQGGTLSVVGPSFPSTSIAAVNFSEDHIKQIFSLACEGCHLKERITRSLLGFLAKRYYFIPRPNPPATNHWPADIQTISPHITRYCNLANNPRKRKTRPWRKSSTRWAKRG